MPAGLAIADEKRLPDGVGVEIDHLLEEHRKGLRDIFDRLAFDRVNSETDEVNRMSGFEGITDLADRFETANAWSLAGPRVDHDHRPLGWIDHRALGWYDPHQCIIHRSGQAVPAQEDLVVVHQYGIDRP